MSEILDVYCFFQAEDGIRDLTVTGVQTCALPICCRLAGFQEIPPADFDRRNSYDLGDEVHVPFHGKETLRRTESAKGSVWRRICCHCLRSNAHRRPVIRTAGVNGAARQNHRRQRRVGSAIDGELDLASENFSIFAHGGAMTRSEEHTSELQSQSNLVCRLLL